MSRRNSLFVYQPHNQCGEPVAPGRRFCQRLCRDSEKGLASPARECVRHDAGAVSLSKQTHGGCRNAIERSNYEVFVFIKRLNLVAQYFPPRLMTLDEFTASLN